jgi:vacuolar-type H+-ATPase subunit E/Vma4
MQILPFIPEDAREELKAILREMEERIEFEVWEETR